jgi:hypothetical protein
LVRDRSGPSKNLAVIIAAAVEWMSNRPGPKVKGRSRPEGMRSAAGF